MVIIAKKKSKSKKKKTKKSKTKKKPAKKSKKEKNIKKKQTKKKQSKKKSTKKKTKKKTKKEKFVVQDHVLVPKHTKLSNKEKQELLEKYQISLRELPRISMKDPAIANMDVSTKDIIKIDRPSPTSKNTVFYRRVVK